jgi:hypothetical protein
MEVQPGERDRPVTPAEARAIVQELVPLCKQLGVSRLRVGDIEVELAAPGTGAVDASMVQAFSNTLNKGMPSEEDLMFWSAPGGPMPRPDDAPAPAEPPKTARGRRG